MGGGVVGLLAIGADMRTGGSKGQTIAGEGCEREG